MKKLISKIMIMSLMLSAIVSPNLAKADITDSNLFEPVVGCVLGGGTGFLVSQGTGNEILSSAIGCGGGLLLGLLLNWHYSSKYGKIYQNDIDNLRANVKEMQLQQAMRASQGDDDDYALRVKTVVPGQKLPDGTITAPTIRETLVPPGENLRIGD